MRENVFADSAFTPIPPSQTPSRPGPMDRRIEYVTVMPLERTRALTADGSCKTGSAALKRFVSHSRRRPVPRLVKHWGQHVGRQAQCSSFDSDSDTAHGCCPFQKSSPDCHKPYIAPPINPAALTLLWQLARRAPGKPSPKTRRASWRLCWLIHRWCASAAPE